MLIIPLLINADHGHGVNPECAFPKTSPLTHPSRISSNHRRRLTCDNSTDRSLVHVKPVSDESPIVPAYSSPLDLHGGGATTIAAVSALPLHRQPSTSSDISTTRQLPVIKNSRKRFISRVRLRGFSLSFLLQHFLNAYELYNVYYDQ